MKNGIVKIKNEICKLIEGFLKFIYKNLVIILNILFAITIMFCNDKDWLLYILFVNEFAKWCKRVIDTENSKIKKCKYRFTSRDENGNVTVKKSELEKSLLYLCYIEDNLYD